MAVTSLQLYQASQLTPAALGVAIIDPDSTDEERLAAGISWIDDNVLPGAKAEVSVPFREVTGFGTVATFAAERFKSLADVAREELTGEGEALYDAAVRSYGRSELNKVVASDAESYDRDSDQDRIQGNQRLEKLLKWATTVMQTSTSSGGANPTPGIPFSGAVKVVARW